LVGPSTTLMLYNNQLFSYAKYSGKVDRDNYYKKVPCDKPSSGFLLLGFLAVPPCPHVVPDLPVIRYSWTVTRRCGWLDKVQFLIYCDY